jgi:ligand-binding sensor domain-containing protein
MDETGVGGSTVGPAPEPRLPATRVLEFSVFEARPLVSARALPALLLVLLGAAPRASALEFTKPLMGYSHSSWGTQEGLPQDSAQSIVQTRDGYLWIATLEGLARFDGYRFTVFDRQSSPPLPDNDVQVLYLSKDGTLWAGLYTGGLVAYRDGAFQTYGERDGLPSVQILALTEDQAGNLWIGTGGAGVVRLAGGRFQSFTKQEGLTNEVVNALLSDGVGGVWIGSVGGLDRFSDGQLRHYRADRSQQPSVTSLAADGERLWIGTPDGLFRAEGEHVVFDERTRALSHPSVQALLLDHTGSLWVGTEDGLNRVRDRAVTHLGTRDGLSDNVILALYEDSEGDLWVGTIEGGINRLHKGPVTAYTSAQGLSGNSVASVLPARNGGLWLGEATTVDLMLGARVQQVGSPRDLGRSAMTALMEDRRGRLWAGNAVGVHCLEAGRWSHYTTRDGLAPGTVRALLEDRQGRLWIGTDGGGLAFLENGRFGSLTTRDGLAGDRIRGLLEDARGTLWIGTYGGLSALTNGAFTNYTTREGLSTNLVHDLCTDSDGALWIGTWGGGLNRLKNGRLTRCTTRQGLFQDAIYSVLDDGRGRLWMISNKGIFFVSRAQFEEFAAGRIPGVNCVAYGVADGMPSAEGNGGFPGGAVGSDGRLYFGTAKGLVAIDPDFPVLAHAIRPPIVEGAWLDGQSVSLRGGVDAPPGTNRLLFRYTSVALSYAARITFSYRLEGFETDWVEAGFARQTEYTNIPPGNYRFVVRAREGGGPWSPPGPAVGLRARAVWYRTRTSQLLFVAGLLVLAGASFQWRIRTLRARQIELSKRVEEALGEVRMLSGLLPICSNCKKIRDDSGAWQQVESYVRAHSEASFTHGICPACVEKLYPNAAKRLGDRAKTDKG